MTDRERQAAAVRRLHRERAQRRSPPRSEREMRAALEQARDAVGAAKAVRERWRYNRDPLAAGRLEELRAARSILSGASQPLRQELGRLPRSPGRERRWGADLRLASDAIIRERKRISKMIRTSERKDK